MSKLYIAVSILFILSACASQTENKTPQTKIGQLNSCMLNEAYASKENGKLARTPDNRTLAGQILNICTSKLGIANEEINRTQSLNIIVSVLKTLR